MKFIFSNKKAVQILSVVVLASSVGACSTAAKFNERFMPQSPMKKGSGQISFQYFGANDEIDLVLVHLQSKERVEIKNLKNSTQLELPFGDYVLDQVDYVQREPARSEKGIIFSVIEGKLTQGGEIFTSCSSWENSKQLPEFKKRVADHLFSKVGTYGPCVVMVKEN